MIEEIFTLGIVLIAIGLMAYSCAKIKSIYDNYDRNMDNLKKFIKENKK